MKPRVLLLCCAALVVLSAGYPGLSARATAQVPGEVPSCYALLSRCAGLTAGGAVKLLGVDGVAPTDESIADGAYPFAETLFAVTRADNDNPNVRLLLDWLQSDQGRRLAVKTGFTALVRGNQG